MTYTIKLSLGAWGLDPEYDLARLVVLQRALQEIARIGYARHPSLPSVYERCRYHWRSESSEGDAYADLAACLERGWGDCADLSPARAAELQERHGINASTLIVELPADEQGRARGHVVVVTPGWTEDPSLALGMPEA